MEELYGGQVRFFNLINGGHSKPCVVQESSVLYIYVVNIYINIYYYIYLIKGCRYIQSVGGRERK